jgi:hypothetical protein
VTPGSTSETAGATAVTISETEMAGDAWSDHIGWIRFKGTGTPEHVVTVSCSGGVATLGGWGFGNEAGWVNFGPFADSTVEAAARPKIDASGNFSGSVWVSGYGGWLDLSTIKASGSPCPSSGGGGGGGDDSGPSPSAPSSSGKLYACHDTKALNYSSAGISDPSLCKYNTYDALIYTNETPAPTVGTCPYFKEYLRLGSVGSEVKKVQKFLNAKLGVKIPVNGIYGKKTSDAVHKFQKMYFDEIIRPWSPPLPLKTTGRWYKTTLGVANVVVGCPSDDVYLEDPKTVHSFKTFFQKLFGGSTLVPRI